MAASLLKLVRVHASPPLRSHELELERVPGGLRITRHRDLRRSWARRVSECRAAANILIRRGRG